VPTRAASAPRRGMLHRRPLSESGSIRSRCSIELRVRGRTLAVCVVRMSSALHRIPGDLPSGRATRRLYVPTNASAADSKCWRMLLLERAVSVARSTAEETSFERPRSGVANRSSNSVDSPVLRRSEALIS
jgi:hypothetical protein